jgi:hypothetical protein
MVGDVRISFSRCLVGEVLLMLRSQYARWAALLLCIPVMLGCQKANFPTDADLAQRSIEKMLKTWQSGGTAADLKLAQPSIIAVDDDWERKGELLAYEIQPQPFNDGVNMHFTVKLTLKSKQGRDVKKEMVYIVGTHPVITIFRK